MKAKNVIVGEKYTAKVSNKIVTVRLDKIDIAWDGGKRYYVTNLNTKRELCFYSAGKFREKV